MWSAAPRGALDLVRWLWRPSVHYHSFASFYQFVDPKVEAQYVHRSALMWQAILRIYLLVVFLFMLPEWVSYLDTPAAPYFWTLFSGGVFCILLLVASCWPRTLPYALAMHATSLCVFGVLFMYHLRLIILHRTDTALAFIYADVQLGPGDEAVCGRTVETVRRLMGQVAQREGLLNCCALWISLSVAGFHSWTVLAYAVLLLSCVGGICENPLVDEKALTSLIFTVCTVGCLLVSVVIERVRRSYFLAQTQLARELQASQLADSVLNHMLKNALADVAANIEIFLAGELGLEVLEDAVVCLRRGIQSCRARMVYLKMVAGEYIPVRNAINVQDFCQQLVAGRSVATHLVDYTVLMDGTLVQLILENALSNAFKHGHPDQAGVELTVEADGLADAAGFPVGPQLISFTVRNVAHPSKPTLTDELVRTLFQGEARLQPGAVVPTLSDGVGLLHCGLAARLGGIGLALRQEGDVVSFTATLRADVVQTLARCPTEDDVLFLANQFPPGLKIFCLDDSAASRRLLEFHLKRGCPSAVVRTFGAVEEDIDVFISEALRTADIVLLDQNLEYTRTHRGTDLCQKLLGLGFRGLVCIRSSDDSQDDQARYAASGAHCSFGKDVLGAKMIQQLKIAYVLKVSQPDTLAGPREYLLHSSASLTSTSAHPVPTLVWGDSP
eukprot:EG_transcript_5648